MGLIQNLGTRYIGPQYHIVYDDWCETVYSTHESPPTQWDEMCVFQRFETRFDDDVSPPSLAEEWLTPDKIKHNNTRKWLQELRQGRRTWQNSLDKETRDDLLYQAPPPDLLAQTREPVFAPTPSSLPLSRPREPLALQWNRDPSSVGSPQSVQPSTIADASSPSTEAPTGPTLPSPRSSTRLRQSASDPLGNVQSWHGKTYFAPSSLLATAINKVCGLTPSSACMLQAQIQGYDPVTGYQEHLPPGIPQSIIALKAKASSDPDLPTLRESLSGPYAEQCWTAMDSEISSLEGKGTWEVVLCSALPPGSKAVPGTWAQRIKRLPSGELSKFKS